MHKFLFTIFVLFFAISIRGFGQNLKIDSLLSRLKIQKEDTIKVMLFRDLGVEFSNQNPKKAIGYWQKGVQLAKKLKFTKGIARNFINIGTGYSYLGKYDSAIIYGDSGLKYSKILNNFDRLALVYLNKGDAFRNLGNFRLALIYCDTASYYAQKSKNIDRQARIYDIISDVYIQQNQFAKGLNIQKKALELYKKYDNKLMEGSAYDDFATIYKQMGKIDSSIYYRKKGIQIGEEIQDFKNLSTYYYGAADLYNGLGNYKLAEFYANKSLGYAKSQSNNIQLATSYALLGKIYNKQKRFSDAIKVGKIAYQYSIVEVQKDWQQNCAEILAEAYTGIGDFKNANQFLVIRNLIKDSLSIQLISDQVASLQSSFEFKEKDKEILLLNKDKELQQQKIQQQRAYIFGAFAIAFLALLGIWLAYNRYKLRQQLKELEIRNQIAADLHDEVGSSLSSIQMLSQMVNNQPHADEKEKIILQKMSNNAKETMEKMSDIVWMIKPGENDVQRLGDRMQRFLFEIGESKNIITHFKNANIESIELSMAQRKNIYLIFKEAINNAAKYSETQEIEVSLVVTGKQLALTISDKGKGFNMEKIRRGNGLENMQNRAKELKAEFKIESFENIGTTLFLNLKL